MKRILLTGRNGQVGWELERTLAPLGEVFAFNHAELDLASPDRIREVVRQTKPDIIVNAAAYTAVDRAESEPDLAMAINGRAAGVMAEEAKRLGAMLVHYSTDYVFDGTKERAYTEDDEPNPVNAYGHSKLAGETAIRAVDCNHLVLRTSWVYGLRGNNFLRTILKLAAEKPTLRVVDDQRGAPTWCRAIAEATAILVAMKDKANGLFHLAAAGDASWRDFAAAIMAAANSAAALEGISSAQYSSPARRPANSLLDCSRLRALGIALPSWQRQLELCLESRNLPEQLR